MQPSTVVPSWAALITTTAISVATVLGTGILALPVTLYKTGLPPFLISFTVTMFAQLGVVYAMTELLQRAYAWGPKAIVLPIRSDDYAIIDNSQHQSPSNSADFNAPTAPSLHTISKLFLSSQFLQWLFEGFVLLHFVSIMVSYALAGPQVLGQLIPAYGRLGAAKCTASFATISSLLIMTISRVLYPLITAATFIKGVLLSFLIGLTLFLGTRVGLSPTTDWGISGVECFLVGSLALSGVVNLMPVTFESCLRSCGPRRPSAVSERFVTLYRRATMLGIVICYVLNMTWCIGVLFIVPQSKLSIANNLGENSTYPLIQALKKHGGNMNNLAAFLVNLFTAVSVTVSFFIMGIGMKHTLDDQLRSLISRRSSPLKQLFCTMTYYFLFYGSITVLAMMNPKAFIKILAGITSLILNVEAGVFIMFMLLQSRRQIWNHSILDTTLSDATVAVLAIAVGGYFVSAVLIDVILYILKL